MWLTRDETTIKDLEDRMTEVERQSLLSRLNRQPDDRIGYCRCGCGQKTSVAECNNAGRGWVRGVPKVYLNGHSRRILTSVYVDPTLRCWIWIKGTYPNGYGQACTDDGKCRPRQAHVMVWEWLYGDVPKGLELDHICHNHPCVNPDHLRAITHTENVQCGAHAVLNPEKVREIRRLSRNGVSRRKIAEHLGLRRNTVMHVVVGDTWRNID